MEELQGQPSLEETIQTLNLDSQEEPNILKNNSSKEYVISMSFLSQNLIDFSDDRCIWNKKGMNLVCTVSIGCPHTAIFININKAKLRVVDTSIGKEQMDKLSEQGFVRVVDFQLCRQNSRKVCFNAKFPQKSENTSLLNSKSNKKNTTFVAIDKDSLKRLKIQSEDHIKFGKQLYRIRVIRNKQHPRFECIKEKQEQNLTAQGSCRVCLSSQQTENDFIITPCFCKGSCGLIHVQCLRKWLEIKVIFRQNPKVISYNLNAYRCQICKAELPQAVTNGKVSKNIFPFSVKTDNHLLIEKISSIDQLAFLIPLKPQNLQISIGRLEDKDIALHDSSISRNHATLLIHEDMTMELRDQGSKYGTFVQFQKDLNGLKSLALLRDRYVIQVEITEYIPNNK